MDQARKPESRTANKRSFIIWNGGIFFGGVMASLTFAYDLIRNTPHYMPSRSPVSLVLFSWIWMLIVNPIFSFGAGCLFGWIMWSLQEGIRTRASRRDQ
jgi:Na+/serine symporter